MRFNNSFAIGAIALMFSLSSCNDDDGSSSQLGKNDAKAKLSEFNTDAKTDLQALADADGLKAVQDFFSLADQDDPFGRVGTDKKKLRDFFREKGSDFRSVFAPSSISKGRQLHDDGFDFEASKGVYEWSAEQEIFVKTGDSEIVQVKFPSGGSATNNAELRITGYEHAGFTDMETGEEYHQPTLLQAEVFVGGTKKAALDLEAEYDYYGFPVTAEIALTVDTFTTTISLDATGDTSSSLAISLKRGQETIVATNIVVTYADDSKEEDTLVKAEGFVQLKNLRLQGVIDFSAEAGEEVDLNEVVKLALYSGNNKIGDIVFVTINQQEIAHIQYADGSKEALEDVMEPVVAEVNSILEELGFN